MPIEISVVDKMQDTDWTRKRTHEQREISIAQKSEAPCVCRQHTHEEEFERVLRPPQCPEGWNFDSLTGQSESESAFWTDLEKVGGNPCRQFVDAEDAGGHDGDIGEKKGIRGNK